jgi:hypothetical protein
MIDLYPGPMKMSSIMPKLLPAGLCLLLLVAAGCTPAKRSEPVAKLEGKVMINGQPLPPDATGSVIFKPRTRGQAPDAVGRIRDGHYRTDKAPVGDVTVIFRISRATGKIIKETPDDAHPHPELQDLVPQSAEDGLRINVTGDNPNQDFDLRD